MSERAKQAHLTIEFDGDRVTGELRDERGAVSAFSGWLDLISALDSLSAPDQKAPRPWSASANDNQREQQCPSQP